MEENKLENEDDDNKLCKICEKETSKYTCPRCGIYYCSLLCYKSDNHLDCSESFYKDCVEEELKSEESDPETRIKMLEILKRIHEDQEHDIEDIEDLAEHGLDSDDEDEEEEAQDLAQRLENVDLDDADTVWALLTDSEKRDFESLLKNGDVRSFLPEWKPWWSYRAENKLIEDLSKKGGENFDYKKNSPSLREAKRYDQISKVPPADCVKNNLLNVLHAYVFTVLYFNGEHNDFPRESVSLILKLSKNLQENEIFLEPDLAIESVSQQALNCQSLITDSQTLSAMKESCVSILRGPNDSDNCFYIKAALSDIHDILSKAKTMNKKGSKNLNNSYNEKKIYEFSKRFPDHEDISDSQLPTDKIRLCAKKIDYYLSWVEFYAKDNFYA